MSRGGNLVSAAWEYFKLVDGGATCQIQGCTRSFLKRASGSSTKFLWSHLDAHHRDLAKQLGRTEKKHRRRDKKTPIIDSKSDETLDVHCYPTSSSEVTPNFAYNQPNNVQNGSNSINMNLIDLINGPDTSNTSHVNESQLSVNEYFCKMICAQLNQMNDKQAHIAREKIHSVIGEILYNNQTDFSQEYS